MMFLGQKSDKSNYYLKFVFYDDHLNSHHKLLVFSLFWIFEYYLRKKLRRINNVGPFSPLVKQETFYSPLYKNTLPKVIGITVIHPRTW